MNSFNPASLINLLGFTVGVALYALLFVMVLRHRRGKIDFLLLVTAVLGVLWNIGELSVFIWRDFGAVNPPAVFQAVAYSALGFLPSVVVHLVWRNSEIENKYGYWLTFIAYGLSIAAGFFHFQSAFAGSEIPSPMAMRILTFGSLALLVALIAVNFKQPLGKKAVWISALLVFALSTLHLTRQSEEKFWLIELVAHQSSLTIALAILYQDYKFAFADLFLKRAISLIFLALTAFGLYVFVAKPLLAMHEGHAPDDVQAAGIMIALWIATALIYPQLHRFAAWLVDKVILRRVDYDKLRLEIVEMLEQSEDIESLLDESTAKLANALTAASSDWRETGRTVKRGGLSAVEFSSREARLFLPTADQPFYEVVLSDFVGARRLLSDEIKMLEAVGLMIAHRVDSLRVLHERCEQEIREQEFSKLTAEAELRALRSQINPHFLFNALTTIGYLIKAAPETALETLMKLTQLLRRVLNSSEEFSTLGSEIKLIESYLEIEKARFEDRLSIEINVPKNLEAIKLPTLILQPVVENAVKHGVSKSKLGGSVRIIAKLEKDSDTDWLKLTVLNTGAEIAQASLAENRKNGVGLNNVGERLRSYYGDSASFSLGKNDEMETKAEIRFPVNSTLGLKA